MTAPPIQRHGPLLELRPQDGDASQPDVDASFPVALISMPTLAPHFPSFQLGLLQPTLERAGIAVQPFSLFLYFGAHIGWSLNDALSAVRPCMAGEWIWSKAAFGEFSDADEYLQHYARNFAQICQGAGCTLDDLHRVRDEQTFTFLDAMLDAVDWSRFQLIGFTVVFQQMVASLAFARRLKERHPDIPIIFGGATFEDDIAEGIFDASPWIDYIHCGDADDTFPELVRRLKAGESMDGMTGIRWRDQDGVPQFAGRAPNLHNLDQTPVPSYDEYFFARRQSGYDAYTQAKGSMIPIETARGCWWGMKQHCTFCGLNRSGMHFRAKSVDGVLDMLADLSRKYGILHFDAIDNIMAPEYLEQLFGQLADAHTDVQIHYEVRPYLSRDQLRELKRGGLYSVQPGIESLNTHVLKLMRKHSTGVNNLSFMKWCTYFGINNLYNLLMGFPGETVEDYEQQLEVIAKIPHFQAPYGVARARADRGSPMYTEPDQHGILNLHPSWCYQHIYPPDRYDLAKVSYYFDHELDGELPKEVYEQTFNAVYEWQARWHSRPRPSLTYSKSWKTLVLSDQRGLPGLPTRVTLQNRAADLYEFCHEPKGLASVVRHFEGDEAWVQAMLAELCGMDLMIHLDGRYLSLALPENPYY